MEAKIYFRRVQSKLKLFASSGKRKKIEFKGFLFEFQMASVICESQKPTSQSDKYYHSNRVDPILVRYNKKIHAKNGINEKILLVRPDGEKIAWKIFVRKKNCDIA